MDPGIIFAVSRSTASAAEATHLISALRDHLDVRFVYVAAKETDRARPAGKGICKREAPAEVSTAGPRRCVDPYEDRCYGHWPRAFCCTSEFILATSGWAFKYEST